MVRVHGVSPTISLIFQIRKVRPALAREFIADEAEVSSDEECSADEEGSNLDDSLEGFINNTSQATQSSQTALAHGGRLRHFVEIFFLKHFEPVMYNVNGMLKTAW